MVERSIPARFSERLQGSCTLPEVGESVVSLIHEMKENGVERIGFVSGRLRKDVIKEDGRILAEHAARMTEAHGFPVFSSTEMFPWEVWRHLTDVDDSNPQKKPGMRQLFRTILTAGVTDVFLAPCWHTAWGAVDERRTAQRNGLTLHSILPLHGTIGATGEVA